MLKLCFPASNNSRTILAKMSTYNSPKLCRHIRLKPTYKCMHSYPISNPIGMHAYHSQVII